MDAVYENMMDMLNGSSDESDSSDDEIDDAADQIRNIAAPVVAPAVPRPIVEENLLVDKVRERFYNEILINESDIFTQPIQTTSTMEGYIENVLFHERDLIEELIPNERIVTYRCNYGIVVWPGFVVPVKIRTTNRGRKKKDKKKKLRKKQGAGTEFNSQITFVVKHDAKLFKFKVFRTGKMQLPGVKQHMIDDVISGANEIVQVLNFHLHTGNYDPIHTCNLLNLKPVMKNYKFIVKMPMSHIIDMDLLLQLLRAERVKQLADMAAGEKTKYPPIFLLKYTRQETKLAISFITPIQSDAKKSTRVNIFMRGKINILGALYTDSTRSICEYLHEIFESNYGKLIVVEGCNGMRMPVKPREYNVDTLDADTFESTLQSWKNYNPDLPTLRVEEYAAVMNFVQNTYEEIVYSADLWLKTQLQNTDIGRALFG